MEQPIDQTTRRRWALRGILNTPELEHAYNTSAFFKNAVDVMVETFIPAMLRVFLIDAQERDSHFTAMVEELKNPQV